MIWNGQELGILAGSQKLKWKESPYVAFYRALFQAYRHNPALYRGEFARIATSRPEAVYAFCRRDGQNRAVVAVNLSARPEKVTLDLGDAAGACTELFTAEAKTLAVKEDLDLGPWEYRVYLSVSGAQPHVGTVNVAFGERSGPLEIDRMALGQGGLSDEPMWESRVAEVRALQPRLIRLFIQEYFQLLPERGRVSLRHAGSLRRHDPEDGRQAAHVHLFQAAPSSSRTVDQDRVEPDGLCGVGATSSPAWSSTTGIAGPGSATGRWPTSRTSARTAGAPIAFKPDSYVSYYATRRQPSSGPIPQPAWAGRLWPPSDRRSCRHCWTPARRRTAPELHLLAHLQQRSRARSEAPSSMPRLCSRSIPALKPETVLDEWNMDLQDPPLDPRFQPCYLLETSGK